MNRKPRKFSSKTEHRRVSSPTRHPPLIRGDGGLGQGLAESHDQRTGTRRVSSPCLNKTQGQGLAESHDQRTGTRRVSSPCLNRTQGQGLAERDDQRTGTRRVSSPDPGATCRFRNALVSVSDKTGLVDFIGPLVRKGMRLVATGGTARLLKKAGMAVLDISEQTGFKEVMDGRLKSLHPRIYIPLLARLNHPEDQKVLKKEGLNFFDLVVCNLYPFSKKKAEKAPHLEEWIDVGGPSMLRASAKNFKHITVICDPADYSWVLQEGVPSLKKRRALAGKAFSLLSEYDHHIADWLSPPGRPQSGLIDGALSFGRDSQPSLGLTPRPPLSGGDAGAGGTSLRYGENPHQKAHWLQLEKTGLHSAIKIQGKALSFNNISDLDSAVSLLRELDGPAVVAVKHNNPCGLACDLKTEKALNKALKADPVSVFGGIVALNQKVLAPSAKQLCSLFLEAVIAPDYSDSALKLFQSKKKNLRILKWPQLSQKNKTQGALSFRSVAGGMLVQEQKPIQDLKKWQFLDTKPSKAIQADLLLSWKVVAHLKSNAIALVSKQQTVGLGMGHVSRVSAVEMAIRSYQKFHPQATDLVLASDGFFPFPDSIELAGKAGIKWILQPGGSLRDKEVRAKATELNINMILTGQRVFAH